MQPRKWAPKLVLAGTMRVPLWRPVSQTAPTQELQTAHRSALAQQVAANLGGGGRGKAQGTKRTRHTIKAEGGAQAPETHISLDDVDELLKQRKREKLIAAGKLPADALVEPEAASAQQQDAAGDVRESGGGGDDGSATEDVGEAGVTQENGDAEDAGNVTEPGVDSDTES
jgi:hypothetical protein